MKTDNELIAEFMGYKYHTWQECKGFGDPGWKANPKSHMKLVNGYLCRTTKDMKYHKSWDWLMPVVERISNIVIKGNPPFNSDQYPRTEIVPSGYIKIENLRSTPISKNVSIEGSLILATYKAVVDFIKWYNQQTKS